MQRSTKSYKIYTSQTLEMYQQRDLPLQRKGCGLPHPHVVEERLVKSQCLLASCGTNAE